MSRTYHHHHHHYQCQQLNRQDGGGGVRKRWSRVTMLTHHHHRRHQHRQHQRQLPRQQQHSTVIDVRKHVRIQLKGYVDRTSFGSNGCVLLRCVVYCFAQLVMRSPLTTILCLPPSLLFRLCDSVIDKPDWNESSADFKWLSMSQLNLLLLYISSTFNVPVFVCICIFFYVRMSFAHTRLQAPNTKIHIQ